MKFINLGLTSHTLWADCNLGAGSPEHTGDAKSFEEIINDKQVIATVPAYIQFFELADECDHEEEEMNGVKGIRFTGTNGNSIFLPLTNEMPVYCLKDSKGALSGVDLMKKRLISQPDKNTLMVIRPVRLESLRLGMTKEGARQREKVKIQKI